MFDLLDIVVSLCTDSDSLFGQYLAHLGGAHMVGRLVPKRAMQASNGTSSCCTVCWTGLVLEVEASTTGGGAAC